jgi:hypothetical protein
MELITGSHCDKKMNLFECSNNYKVLTAEIKCINCQSSNVEKITSSVEKQSGLLQKMFSVLRLSNTLQCNACNYEW